MRAHRQICVWSFTLLLASLPAFAQQQPTGSWNSQGSSWEFDSGGSASDGTYVYFFGGYQYNYPNNQYYPDYYMTMRRYDPVNNSWSTMAYMPEENYRPAGAYYSGTVYAFGNAWYAYGAIYKYSISSNSWDWASSYLTNDRFYAAAATLGNRIYIVGGLDTYSWAASNLLDEFNPSDDSITNLSGMSTSRYDLTAASALGKFYALAGYDDSSPSAANEEYDPSTDSWTNRAPISTGAASAPRYGPSAFTIGNRIYVVGGLDGNWNYTNTCLEYFPMNNSWAQRANMPTQKYYFGAGAVSTQSGPRAFVYGGYPSTTSGALFTPPDFGSPPNPPSNVLQIGDAGPVSQGGFTGTSMRFEMNVTDPNAGQQVGLRLRVRRSTDDPDDPASWTTLDTGLAAQGTMGLDYPVPSGGPYDWEYQAYDSYQNHWPTDASGLPAWQPYSGNATSPDFNSDQMPPSAPVLDTPGGGQEVLTSDPQGTTVTLKWFDATDDSPADYMRYDVQVSNDVSFTTFEATANGVSGTQVDLYVRVASQDRYWRARAIDAVSNLGPWSDAAVFRVTSSSSVIHEPNEHRSPCTGSVSGAMSGTLGALLGAVMAAAAATIRRRRALLSFTGTDR